MSSIPPYNPPGGGAPPPYDPKTQYRVFREQQRAAWRAQRDAWRAQRHAWKSGMGGRPYVPSAPSIVGPLILIAIGIVAMLIITGHMDASQFWEWYGHWWPLLLIGAGLALLAEWAFDAKRQVPVRRGGGFVGLLIFFAFLGAVGAMAHHNWDTFRGDWGQNDDFWNMFGRPQHDLDQAVLTNKVPANAVVNVENPRGDVSVTSGEGQEVQVQAHEVAYAEGDSEARKIFNAEAARVQVSGSTVLVKSDGHASGRVDLRVTVPKDARVTVNANRGDVTAASLGAGATITASHGDVRLNTIQGTVQVHLTADKHDLSAHQITGDLVADGKCNDLTLSEIKGKVTVSGDIYGTAHLENMAGSIHLHTPVTDMQIGDLPGDLTLDQEDLRVTEAKGPVRVTTESKNVDLTQIAGDTFVQDRDGNISIAPSGAYNVEAKSTRGNADIELTLPPSASASVDAQTRNGDIQSDYPIPTPTSSGDGDSKSVKFAVGSGQAKVVLSTDVGDVHIKRGTGFTESTSTAAMPKAPVSPNAPRLKPPKGAPPAPVEQ